MEIIKTKNNLEHGCPFKYQGRYLFVEKGPRQLCAMTHNTCKQDEKCPLIKHKTITIKLEE